jgi:hypothetical protein
MIGVGWMLKLVMSQIRRYSLEAKGYVGQDKRVLLETRRIHLV